MDVLKIVLGAIATVLVFYSTSAMLLAQKQLLAATRLHGYLTYWQNWIIEHDISKVYALGVMWNRENEDAKKRGGGVAEMMKLEDERKKQLASMKQQLENGTDNFGFDKVKIARALQRYSKESIDEYARVTSQNLIEGKTFISDEEATALGVAFTIKCIELKMGILDLVNGATSLMIALINSPETFEVKDYSAEISTLIWKGISVSRAIDMASRAATATSSKSVLSLTWQNIITGRRLSKR